MKIKNRIDGSTTISLEENEMKTICDAAQLTRKMNEVFPQFDGVPEKLEDVIKRFNGSNSYDGYKQNFLF